MKTPARPTFATDEHFRYLDWLRESGATNMFGASPYLQKSCPGLSKDEARKVVVYWIDTFSERHKAA